MINDNFYSCIAMLIAGLLLLFLMAIFDGFPVDSTNSGNGEPSMESHVSMPFHGDRTMVGLPRRATDGG